MAARGIHIGNLKESDVGRWVQYVPGHGPRETGRIKSWNTKYIFVVYNCARDWQNYRNYTAAATKPEDLEFIRAERAVTP